MMLLGVVVGLGVVDGLIGVFLMGVVGFCIIMLLLLLFWWVICSWVFCLIVFQSVVVVWQFGIILFGFVEFVFVGYCMKMMFLNGIDFIVRVIWISVIGLFVREVLVLRLFRVVLVSLSMMGMLLSILLLIILWVRFDMYCCWLLMCFRLLLFLML